MDAYRLSRTESHSLRGGAAPLLLHVALPEGHDMPPEGWPLVMLCDATDSFATLVETVRRCASRPSATGIAPAVVAGIAYDREAMDAKAIRLARIRDYTFGPAEAEDVEATGAAETGNGGQMLALITEAISGLIRDYSINRKTISLFGHSLVGKFVLDVLVRHPALFSTYVAISPSIWWNRPELEQRIEGLSPQLAGLAPRRVMVAVGEWEQGLAPWQQQSALAADMAHRRERRRMIDNAREVGALLGQRMRPEDRILVQVFPDEDHASVIGIAYNRGLRLANAARF